MVVADVDLGGTGVRPAEDDAVAVRHQDGLAACCASQTNSLLQAKLKAKSKVEVVRRGLRLLQEATDRESLRGGYRRASLDTRESLALELPELDPLASEGLDEP